MAVGGGAICYSLTSLCLIAVLGVLNASAWFKVKAEERPDGLAGNELFSPLLAFSLPSFPSLTTIQLFTDRQLS